MDDLLRRTRQWSMQTHLVAFVIFITLLAWASGVSVMARGAQREVETLHDLELTQVASVLLGLSGHELQEMGPTASVEARIQNGRTDTRNSLGDDYRYQVWSEDGKLLLTNFGIPATEPMAQLQSKGHSWKTLDGEPWRVYSLYDPVTHLEIQVAERAALRAWTFPEAHGVLPMLVLASFGIVLVPALWLLRRLLRPLREMAGALRQRTPSNLEPLQLDHAPAELVPVLSAINRLFGRVSEAMRREAGFTALAAHELRTPLATLRLLAESANQASNDEERGQALAELIRSADRCSHLQEQLLTLSRLETIKAADMVGQVDMTEVVMNALVDQVAPARRRHIKLASRLDGSAICGHPFGVQTLLRNLICNAVNYTPAGGRVEISTVTEGNDVIVHVDDSGPGVPADQRERVFGRFERLQREQTSGVGLGLSIVRTVAQAHEATVSLHDSPLGGLRVAVNFVGRAIQVPLEPEMEVEETVEPEPHGGSLATAGNPAD